MTIKSAPQSIQDKLKPLREGTFHFACHPQVSCFTECCRKLNLLLTPYDLIRLKNHLRLPSSEFIDGYTQVRFDAKQGIPLVFLKMRDDERKTCPFVTASGCQVYPDRPSACRIYPLARASRKHAVHGNIVENYFVFQEDHCQGFEENRVWSVEQWISDQGLEPYHEMNNLWMEIITHPAVRGKLSERQLQMFYLASYDLDRFRQFVFGSRFLTLFELDEDETKEAEQHDAVLLRLACRWLRFCLCGDQSLQPKAKAAADLTLR